MRADFAAGAPGVTFSCGLASTTATDAVPQQELWERADAALYRAKELGKDRADIARAGEVRMDPEARREN